MDVSTASVVSCVRVLPFMSTSMRELFWSLYVENVVCWVWVDRDVGKTSVGSS